MKQPIEILEKIDELKEFYDLSTKQLFPFWGVMFLHYDDNYDESVLEEIYGQTVALFEDHGDVNHVGINAYYFDSNENHLYLYSFIYGDKGIIDANFIADSIIEIYDKELGTGTTSSARRELSEILRTVLKSKGTVEVKGISTLPWKENLEGKISQRLSKLFRLDCPVELEGADFFLKQETLRSEDMKGKSTNFELFTSGANSLLELHKQGAAGLGTGYTAIISAYSLADITQEWQDRLFDRNVRWHLGHRKEVNRSLLNSLKAEDGLGRKTFWYGHNGITVLCDSVDFIDDPDSRTHLEVTNPQIVNGCQTSMAICKGVGPKNARNKPDIDFGVSARFIVLEGKDEQKEDAARDIALKTNTQTAVQWADLKTNDLIQKKFAQMLNDYGDGWFYVRKKGDWEKNKRSKNKYAEVDNDYRIILPEKYQQAWRAYTGDPAGSVNARGAVWLDDKLYNKIFCESRRPCDIVFASVMLEWFSNVFSVDKMDRSLATDIHPGLEKHLDKFKKAKTRAAVHALALFGSMVETVYGSVDRYPEEYIDTIVGYLKRGKRIKTKWITKKPEHSWKTLEPAFSLIFQVLAQFCKYDVDKINTRSSLEVTLYGELKKPVAFQDMWSSLETERRFSLEELILPKL